ALPVIGVEQLVGLGGFRSLPAGPQERQQLRERPDGPAEHGGASGAALADRDRNFLPRHPGAMGPKNQFGVEQLGVRGAGSYQRKDSVAAKRLDAVRVRALEA